MSDSGAVDAAVYQALAADVTLNAMCPDGVWRDNAPQARTRVVIYSQAEHHAEPMYGGTAFETFHYTVTAVMKDQSPAAASSAAARITTVLEGLTTITGYDLTVAQYGERVGFNEPDPINPDAFWQHFGGVFEIMVTPTA